MSLERIEVTPFAVIAGDILQNRKTGSLTLFKSPLRKVLYWSQGELVMSVSSSPADAFPDFLVRRGVVAADRAREVFGDDPNNVVGRFHESGLMELSTRQIMLRDWLTAQFLPLFSLDEGTAAFADDEPLPIEKRIFLPSTPALVIEGIRGITNGLVLRRCLGDLNREIQIARNSRFSIEALPLNEQERAMAASLTEPMSIEAVLKRHATHSLVIARLVISMMALGVYTTIEERFAAPAADFAEMQRDLELLAAIGANDQRSLRAAALSKQLSSLDHYQLLDVPRAATRTQIVTAAEEMKKRYDASTFPPAVREAIQAINRRVDEAADTLRDAGRRAAYDRLLHARSGEGAGSLQQRLTQRSIAEQNFVRAKTLTTQGDYYGAIVLLKQTVNYVPEHAEAWHLLGACQERNPKWRRDAAESFQRALSIDPNNVEAMISLGDLYKSEGLISRAQSCYEDVLKIAGDNQQAKSRLQGLKKR